jgi:hypothetical protein
MEELEDGLFEGVCDVVPEYHAPTESTLCIGHNVYYEKATYQTDHNKLKITKPYHDRHPVYITRKPDGSWTEARQLEYDFDEVNSMYTTGAAQRITYNNGDVLMPLSLTSDQDFTKQARMICTCLYSFDGEELKFKEQGNMLRFDCKRGLLEPSLVKHNDRYYMTIRTEDNRGHVSVSEDGLNWSGIFPWEWEDGEPIITSTTQQHWLKINGELWLVYTRKTPENSHVMRWRSPLFAAKVCLDNAFPCLIKDTEQVIMPMRPSELDNTNVAKLGNFDIRSIDENTAWLTVGENMVEDERYTGDTLMGIIKQNSEDRSQ